MTAAQKFMFDMTFEGTPPHSGSAPAQPDPIGVADAALAKDKEAEAAETEENPEEAEEQPGYSEEQMEAAKKEAYEEGKQEGMQSATEMVEQQTLVALRTIAQHLTELFDRQEHANNTLMKDGVGVAATIVKKLFPAMDERHGEDEICRLIEHTLLRLIEEPRVVVKINPELAESLGKRLDGLKAGAGYEGRIIVKEEASMNVGDCSLEWGDGSAERNVSALWRFIDEIIENNIGKIVPEISDDVPEISDGIDVNAAPDESLDNSDSPPTSEETTDSESIRPESPAESPTGPPTESPTESPDVTEDAEKEPARASTDEPTEKPQDVADSGPANPGAAGEADNADTVQDTTETEDVENNQADSGEPPHDV